MNRETVNSILSNTYCSADESYNAYLGLNRRRGLMDTSYKNTTCDLTIQQKRYLESKLEKERNEREEIEETHKITLVEFSRFKELTLKKQSLLEAENLKLRQEFEFCRGQYLDSESEKQGLLKSIMCLQKTIQDQNEAFRASNAAYEQRLERIEAREKRLRDSTMEWCKNIDDRNCHMISKFEELISQMVKSAFQNYSHSKMEIKERNLERDLNSTLGSHSCVENKNQPNVFDVMQAGIRLPPCRKKPKLSEIKKSEQHLNQSRPRYLDHLSPPATKKPKAENQKSGKNPKNSQLRESCETLII